LTGEAGGPGAGFQQEGQKWCETLVLEKVLLEVWFGAMKTGMKIFAAIQVLRVRLRLKGVSGARWAQVQHSLRESQTEVPMVKARMILVFWIAGIFGFLVVNSSKSQSVPESQAIKDLSIVTGAQCNQEGVPGILQYLKNKNKSKSIVARVEVTQSPSQGDSSSEVHKYTVPPQSKIQLGCSRVGGGAPIVVEVSWEIKNAKYK
jgi:hypothetical protein